LLAEAEYCLENEMTNNLSDFIIRRTGRLYFERNNINSNIDTLENYFQQQLNIPVNVQQKNKMFFEKEFNDVVAFRN
jgi:glycerol-3-phosphate dehydrogenase